MYFFDISSAKWFNRNLHILTPFILFLHSMDKIQFSSVLEKAFQRVASEHGQNYGDGAASAWGLVGASYLGYALCGLGSSELRNVQYKTREQAGPIILDCKWYDDLVQECLGVNRQTQALLPGPGGTLCPCSVTRELFLEMLDFCREG